MPIQVTSDNMKLSPSMEELAVSKLDQVIRMIPDYSEETFHARVVLNTGQEEDTFLAKLDVDADKIHVTSSEVGYSLENALIGAINDLVRQIKKEKAKFEADWEVNRELKRFVTPDEDQ